MFYNHVAQHQKTPEIRPRNFRRVADPGLALRVGDVGSNLGSADGYLLAKSLKAASDSFLGRLFLADPAVR